MWATVEKILSESSTENAVRRVLRSLAVTVADDSGLSSVEYAVLIAVVLIGAAAGAYALGRGVGEPPSRIVAGQSSATGGTPSAFRPVEPVELVVRPPSEPDSVLWPWALFSLVLSAGSTAAFLAIRKAMIFVAQLKVRRKVREATTEEEVEEAFQRMQKGADAEMVVRLRAGDTALVGRNLPQFNVDWMRSTTDISPMTAPVDASAEAEREATVARFMAAFTVATETVPAPSEAGVLEASPMTEPLT